MATESTAARLVRMSSEPSPSLADDVATLGCYGVALADQFEALAEPWLGHLVDQHAPGLSSTPDVQLQLRDQATALVQELRALFTRDIADQPVGPLEVIRRSIRVPTEILVDAGVAPVPRDAFDMRRFPDDLFGLIPASFGDIHPSLHEPGLMWGAAKAHVHLRRRRDADGQ